MRIKFWSKPIVVLLVVAFLLGQVLFPAGRALAANSDRVQSPAQAQAGGQTIVTVSGSEVDNNLRISLIDTPGDTDNTGMRVQMFFAGKWVDNIYDPEGLPDIYPVSKGTSLCIDGLEYPMGGGQTFYDDKANTNGPPTPATLVSFTKPDAKTIVGKWLIEGKIAVEQTITYNDGDQYYTMRWNIKANSGSFSNLSLIHGEDTYLYGSDEGGGWWRPSLGKGSVGVTHPTNGMQMWLQAVSTTPSHYSSQDYDDNQIAKAQCALDDYIDPAPDADNGYALQWDRASLNAGQTWSVTAEEHLKAPAHPAITDVNPGSGILAGGNSVLITGKDFSKDTEFYFGGVKAACTFISATSVRCTVPAGKVLGPIKIELREYLPSLDINYSQVYSGLYSYKTAEPKDLPNTGFAPSVVTRLPAQPAENAYSALDGLWLEIPSQKVMAKVVGVPEVNGSWDVSWLGADAGWLAGTAYPTWIGNSVITAHVTDTLGHPGPFAKLGSLKYGDRVTVYLSGSKYVFEVRDSWLSTPKTSWSALTHLADHSYLTLVTCSEFDAASNKYLQRRVVRLVMVGIQ